MKSSRGFARRFTWVRVGAVLLAMGAVIVPVIAATQDYGGWSPPKPAAEHEQLARFVGNWTCDVASWGQTSRGTEKVRALPGGFWVVGESTGSMAGSPFEGIGLYGYDPAEKKYVSVWVDSQSPSLMVTKGDYDESTDSFVFHGEVDDPSSGRSMKMKIVESFVDADRRRMTMSMEIPHVGEKEMVAIDYRRSAAASGGK